MFFYGELGGGNGPSFFRRGGPEELQRRVDAGEVKPDYGPPFLDDAAGGVLVGARRALIAFNVNLRGDGPRRERSQRWCASAAAASPAFVRSGSTFRGRASSR